MTTEANMQMQVTEGKQTTLTVRDVLHQFVDCTDFDAEVCFTFHGSDPIPVTAIEEGEEGQVVLAAG